jgi:predicted Zn-dependent protease
VKIDRSRGIIQKSNVPKVIKKYHRTLPALYHTRMKRFISILLITSLVLPAISSDELPELGDESSATLSSQQEQALGRQVMMEIRGDRDYYLDPFTVEYLNRLGYRLVANAGAGSQTFEFFVVRDSTLNAFALPGGFIGVHTGLLLAAENESELASVLSHEIAHVTQHHLARLMSAESRNQIPMLAAMAVAILAGRGNAQISSGAIMSAQAGMIQSQLTFTREHEREADRIGMQTLVKSGYDARAMASFFERLQKYTRFYETNAPAYLRTHPVTYERIADIENRLQSLPFRPIPDSLDFQLMRARLRALLPAPREAVAYFENRIQEGADPKALPHLYGYGLALLKAQRLDDARKTYEQLHLLLPHHAWIEQFGAALAREEHRLDEAITRYQEALNEAPASRGLQYGYLDVLLEAGQSKEALQYIAKQLTVTRDDDQLYEFQARAFALSKLDFQQHRAQAEAYFYRGNLMAAIDQLQIALRSGPVDFYTQSSAEARLKEMKALADYDRKQRQRAGP